MYEALALLGAFTLLYGIFAKRIEMTVISGPIIFVAFGFLIGPSCLHLLTFEGDAELLSALAELTLALVLFTDAAGTDLGVLKRAEKLPIRLLAIGLPLTILLGVGSGMLLFPTLPILVIALLATMLAPTDAALGKAVVENPAVPGPVRQGLNVESGLNDGICVPILFLFLALITGTGGGEGAFSMGLGLFAKVVGIGLVTGVVMTLAALFLLKHAAQRKWLAPAWAQVLVIALAFTSFGISQALGGSGFIACFVGGMLFGALAKTHREELLGAAEGVGNAFGLLTWTLFGAAVLAPAIEYASLPIILYAILSLTVVRMLPVFLCLLGLKESTETKLFMGWFGPRGLASIVFLVIVMNESGFAGIDTLKSVVCWTVLLSILLHGLTANPWARGFGKRAKQEAAA